jgi:phosphatidylglycerol:prolipoprotein diacylglycerol transferase
VKSRLFTLFDLIPFPSYFTLLVTGFILATILGALWAKRIGQDPDVIVDLGLAMLLAGVAGARLLHVVADGYFWDYVHICTDPGQVAWQMTAKECAEQDNATWDAVRSVCVPGPHGGLGEILDRCTRWAHFWAGGLTYYGGFIGASVAAWYLLKLDRFPFWKAADMAGMAVPFGLAFGRMGCLLAGCCFGKPTDAAWALTFPPNSPASEAQFKHHLLDSPTDPSLPVHPTQALESFGCLLIAAVLILYLHGRKRYDGHVFVAFVAAYASLRFLLEFWRDDDRGGILGLSTSQLLGLLAVAFAIWIHRNRMAKRAALATAATR